MARSTAGRPHRSGLQPTQVLAGVVGLFFLVIGVVGLVRGGFADFTGDNHAHLLVFAVNPLHNILHTLVGLVGVLMAMTSATARVFGWVLFVVYGLMFVWGMMLAGVVATNAMSGLGNPFNLNAADNWLHLASAALGLVIAVVPARRRVVVEAGPTPEAEEPVGETARPKSTGVRGLFGWHGRGAPR